MPHFHGRPARTPRRVTTVALGVAVATITMLATTSTPIQAAGSTLPNQRGITVPAGAVRSDKRPEALGLHTRKFAPKAVQTRVAGGSTANSTDFPGVVGIRDYFVTYDDDQIATWVSTCTGTVISHTKILTAGHCTIDFKHGTIQVIAGRNDLDDETAGTVYGVSNVWTHQGFNLRAQYNGTNPHAQYNGTTPLDDVSVLTLRTPIDPVYTPYALTAQGDQTPYTANTDAVIAGYGITKETRGSAVNHGIAPPAILHTATIQIQSNSTCNADAASDGASYDSNRMTCAGVAPTTPTGSDGIGSCDGDDGGPLIVGGVEVGIYDWRTYYCDSDYGFYERLSYYNSAITNDMNLTNLPVNLDFSGDGHADLMFRSGDSIGEITGTGLMLNTPTANDNRRGITAISGFNCDPYGPPCPSPLNSGWSKYQKIFRVTNWNGDHTESIFAVATDGALYQYKTDGKGNAVGSPSLIGSGWTMFNDIVVTNNWTGNGRPNLMGRKANGDLILYTSNGAGGWTNSHGTLIGTGWSMFNTIITPGNWRGGGQAMIGRTTTGDLRLYESNGAGGWKNGKGTLIGTGWNSLPIFLSPGDWNGDNLIDLIGISTTGDMKLYRTDGLGHWLNGHGELMTDGFWGAGAFDPQADYRSKIKTWYLF